MPRKRSYEFGRDYGQPRQRMRGKKFEVGDRIRFKPDKSLGTVVRATAYSLMVRFDDGEVSQVSPYEVIHSMSLKKRNPMPLTTWVIRANSKKKALEAVSREMYGVWYQVVSVKKKNIDTYLVTIRTMEKRNPKYVSHGVAGQKKAKRPARPRRNVVPAFGQAVRAFIPKSVGLPNPKLTKIYGRVLRIEAQKTGSHHCDAKCKRANHRYFHNFKSGPSMYGTPDKRTLIIK